MRKLLLGALELANDYRDTLYYSAALVFVGACFLLQLGDLKSAAVSFLDLLVLREIFRAVFWMLFSIEESSPKSSLLLAVSVVFYSPFTLVQCLLGNISRPADQVALGSTFTCLTIWFFSSELSVVKASERPALVARIYWKDLFDYPRKQKPPKQRGKKLLRALKEGLDKFLPSFVPEPVGGRA